MTYYRYRYVLWFVPRTKRSTSVAKTRSSSGLVKWPTWRSSVQINCVRHVSASKRPSAAGLPGKNILGWDNLPLLFKNMYVVTRRGGEWRMVNKSQVEMFCSCRNIERICFVFFLYFFLFISRTVTPNSYVKPEQLLSFSVMCECGQVGDTTCSSALQLSQSSASGEPTQQGSNTTR